MTRYARAERAALADTLTVVGPGAPTLCGGWAARDLVAHLLIRERNPLAAGGILVRQLADYGERERRALASRDFDGLVAKLRNPPLWSPTSNPLVDELMNVLEMFVHHEDVRRAQPGWKARAIDPGLETALWNVVRRTARFGLRRFRAAVAIEAPGHGGLTAGAGGTEVRLSGRPAELTMFLTGRQGAAEVALTGPEELVERLRTARLGL